MGYFNSIQEIDPDAEPVTRLNREQSDGTYITAYMTSSQIIEEEGQTFAITYTSIDTDTSSYFLMNMTINDQGFFQTYIDQIVGTICHVDMCLADVRD